MNSQLIERQFSDAFIMINFEISFEGIKKWFSMANMSMDDASLFKALLSPKSIDPEKQTELLYLILNRYEDVFFQVHRMGLNEPEDDTNSPIHQLLLRMMSRRTLYSEENTLLDLYLIIQEDRAAEDPKYPTLHQLFDYKAG